MNFFVSNSNNGAVKTQQVVDKATHTEYRFGRIHAYYLSDRKCVCLDIILLTPTICAITVHSLKSEVP